MRRDEEIETRSAEGYAFNLIPSDQFKQFANLLIENQFTYTIAARTIDSDGYKASTASMAADGDDMIKLFAQQVYMVCKTTGADPFMIAGDVAKLASLMLRDCKGANI